MRTFPQHRNENTIVYDTGDEVLVYDLQKNTVYCLNKTSAMVWHECDGHKSISHIAQTISRKLKTNFSDDFV